MHPDLEEKITGSSSLEMIDLLDQNSILFYGVTDSTMPRGQGWNFMNLGKFIERCMLTIETTYAHSQKIDHQLDTRTGYSVLEKSVAFSFRYELYLKTYTRDQHNTERDRTCYFQ